MPKTGKKREASFLLVSHGTRKLLRQPAQLAADCKSHSRRLTSVGGAWGDTM